MPVGTLEVQLISADGIKDTEIFGKGDPYCILTCGKTKLRSTTAEDQGSKPQWNQKLSLAVDEITSDLAITIYNKNLLEDAELGTCIIPLARVFNSGNKLPTTNFSVIRPSGRTQGEIKLALTFLPKNLSTGMEGPYGSGHPRPYGPGPSGPYGSQPYPGGAPPTTYSQSEHYPPYGAQYPVPGSTPSLAQSQSAYYGSAKASNEPGPYGQPHIGSAYAGVPPTSSQSSYPSGPYGSQPSYGHPPPSGSSYPPASDNYGSSAFKNDQYGGSVPPAAGYPQPGYGGPPPTGPHGSHPSYGGSAPPAAGYPPAGEQYRQGSSKQNQYGPQPVYGAPAGPLSSAYPPTGDQYGKQAKPDPYGAQSPYGGSAPPSTYPPPSDQSGKPSKQDTYSSQPGYGGSATPPAGAYPPQGPSYGTPHSDPYKKTGMPAGYPPAAPYGSQLAGHSAPTNPDDPYAKGSYGDSKYNVGAAAAGLAALGLAGAAAYGVNEHHKHENSLSGQDSGKLGKPGKIAGYGSQPPYGGYAPVVPQVYPSAGYPPHAGHGAAGYSQPAPYYGGSNYTPTGYPVTHGGHGSSYGKYEQHHDGSHKMNKGKKDKKHKKGRK